MAYVYRRRDDPSFFGHWFYEATLTAPDVSQQDGFGTAVGISGDTAVIGTRSGYAYVYMRSAAGEWMRVKKVSGPSTAKLQNIAVDISNDRMVVGFSTSQTGVAVVLTKSQGSWREWAVLTPDSSDSNDNFGISVAVVGDTIAVGGQESVLVFSLNGDSWQQTAKVISDDGENGDAFGASVALLYSVDLEQNILLVGASNHNGSEGAAYVFLQTSSGDWEQETKLTADISLAGGGFGRQVALEQRLAVVGASNDDSLYVFEFNDEPPRRVTYPTTKSGGRFGVSICLDEREMLVGAFMHSRGKSGLASGTAYLYEVPELAAAKQLELMWQPATDPPTAQRTSQTTSASADSRLARWVICFSVILTAYF